MPDENAAPVYFAFEDWLIAGFLARGGARFLLDAFVLRRLQSGGHAAAIRPQNSKSSGSENLSSVRRANSGFRSTRFWINPTSGSSTPAASSHCTATC